MSNEHPSNTNKSGALILVVALSGLALLLIIVFLVMALFKVISQNTIPSDATFERHEQFMSARLQPVFRVNIGQIVVEKVILSPEQLYTTLCQSCHAVEATGAPQTDNHAEWQQRFDEKGYELLINHALNGFQLMPARGGNPRLSDQEVIGAVRYMLEKAQVALPPLAEEKASMNTESTTEEKTSNIEEVTPLPVENTLAPSSPVQEANKIQNADSAEQIDIGDVPAVIMPMIHPPEVPELNQPSEAMPVTNDTLKE